MITVSLRQKSCSHTGSYSTSTIMGLCGVFLAITVITLSSGHFQSKREQRKQDGAAPVFALNDANRPLLSYDGQRMAVLPEVGLIEVYEIAAGRKLQSFRVPNSANYAMSADGKQIVIWGGDVIWNDGRHYKSKPVLRLFDIDSGKEVLHNDAGIMRGGHEIGYLSPSRDSRNISADLKLVASLGPSQNTTPSVTLGDLRTQQLISQFSFGEYTKHGIGGAVVMTPDARVIAASRRDLSGTNRKQTVIWEVSSRRELLRFPFFGLGLGLSSDGRRLVIGVPQGEDFVPEIWDTVSGKRVSEIGLEFGSERWLIGGGDLSPDGKLLATTRKGYVLLWNTDNGRLIALQQASSEIDDIVKSVAFSGDGRFLAMSSLGEETKVWRVTEIVKEASVSNTALVLRLLR